jgi:hypothetical protein
MKEPRPEQGAALCRLLSGVLHDNPAKAASGISPTAQFASVRMARIFGGGAEIPRFRSSLPT